MIIYKITNIKNNKSYIGKTVHEDYTRIIQHIISLRRNKHFNIYLQRSFNYYGEENFIYLILDNGYTKKDLNEKEKYWIKFYRTINAKYGYNLTEGGDGGRQNKIGREKISKALKGRKHSEEYKKKMSKRLKDREYKEEWKQKIREAKKNISDITRKKLSDSQKGKKHSQETIEKLKRAKQNVSKETRKK